MVSTGKLHIVLLTRKYLDGSVSRYLNKKFYFNAFVHTVSTRRYKDIRIPKVKKLVFLAILRQRNPSLNSQGSKHFFLN